MNNLRTTYSSLAEFYNEDPQRQHSGEADYGVWWQDTRPYPRWRVSYIKDTGEVYAVELSLGGRVMVLGHAEPDSEGLYYRTLDGILDGWAEVCGQPAGLAWVRQRLSREGTRAQP